MAQELDSLIAEQYPQLSDLAFFDFAHEAPIPKAVMARIKTLGHRLLPSPHSSEEQSEFDRVLMLLRKEVAGLFSVSLANFDVVVFGTPEAAVEAVFESFRSRESRYVVHESFGIDTAGAEKLAELAGVKKAAFDSAVSGPTLLCVSGTQSGVALATEFRSRKPGSVYVLANATPAAPFWFVDLIQNSCDFVLLSMKPICGIEICLALFKKEAAELLVPAFYGGGAVAFSCERIGQSILLRTRRSYGDGWKIT